MKMYRMEYTQDLPLSPDRAWAFFQQPGNLEAITPRWLRFAITSPPEEAIHPGQIISYRISLLPGLRQTWVTEITHVVPKALFVDEQRFGPYRFWHHQHHFTPIPGGTRVIDRVHYGLPLGPLGRLAHFLFVHRLLKAIFAHRRQTLEQKFARALP